MGDHCPECGSNLNYRAHDHDCAIGIQEREVRRSDQTIRMIFRFLIGEIPKELLIEYWKENYED